MHRCMSAFFSTQRCPDWLDLLQSLCWSCRGSRWKRNWKPGLIDFCQMEPLCVINSMKIELTDMFKTKQRSNLLKYMQSIFWFLRTWAVKRSVPVLLLWSPYVIGQTIIFSSCFFFFFMVALLSFFPRLISAVGDWMSTIIPHMVWP